MKIIVNKYKGSKSKRNKNTVVTVNPYDYNILSKMAAADLELLKPKKLERKKIYLNY